MSKTAIHALVTGASRGIGKSIAGKLLDVGARVIGTARSSTFPDELEENNRFIGLYVDLLDKEQIVEKLKPVFKRNEAPNVLVNNAGISEDCGFENNDETWLHNWNRTVQINLTAPAMISKWALNRWVEEGNGGILVNIASRAAYRGDTQEFASYAASKGGMVAFTKSIARDFGEHDIVAYTIAPGFIKTDMAMDVVDVYGEEYLTRGMAFDEITSPSEVGELVTFLASGKVKHMTGATLHINGGSYMI